jgi:hypothetical protein
MESWGFGMMLFGVIFFLILWGDKTLIPFCFSKRCHGFFSFVQADVATLGDRLYTALDGAFRFPKRFPIKNTSGGRLILRFDGPDSACGGGQRGLQAAPRGKKSPSPNWASKCALLSYLRPSKCSRSRGPPGWCEPSKCGA